MPGEEAGQLEFRDILGGNENAIGASLTCCLQAMAYALSLKGVQPTHVAAKIKGNEAMTSINLDQLNRMTCGDAGLALEVLTIFRSQADVWSPLLDAAADATQWADACHTIKGAARSIGADDLAKFCETAEKRGRTGEVTRVEAAVLLNDVKNSLADSLEALAEAEFALSSQQVQRARA